MKVIDYKKFDINNIIYKEPVKTAGGCLLSKTLYGYNSEEIPIYIQTPRLKNVGNLEISDSRTYIELELDKQHINFYEFINNVDDHNISKTHSRSEDWFQQKLPMDVIDDFYKANIKMRKYNKSPVIKFKIPLYKNKTKKGCDIFGDDLKPIDISEVKKDVEVICILELQGIKFFKQRFEAEWNVVQLRAYLKPNISRECLINEDFLSDNEDTNNDNDIVEEPKEQVKNIEIKISQNNDTKIKEIIKVSNNEESELNSEPIKEEEAVVEEEALKESVLEEAVEEAVEAVENKTTIDNKNIEIEIPEDNTEEESHDLEESENNNNNSESESESESDYNSDNDTIQDYYSDNFSDEDEICEGLDKHLEEINFAEDEEEEKENSHTIEEPQSDSEIESDADEAEKEELKAENTIEPVNNSAENKQYLNQNIGDLISEIEKLKKIAFDKDEEVNQLKSKYKNLYSELNI
jgi:hypothetical protein